MAVEVKINCSCGTPYKFDVEPVDNQMPCAIQCPNCGADGAGAANDYLRAYAASLAQAAPAARLAATPAIPRLPATPLPAAKADTGRKKRAYGEPNLALGALGAATGAFAGMMVWYLIIKFINYELGIVAWGVGVVIGFGCRTLGGGYSVKLGVIAGACALLAIVGGEYLGAKAQFDKFVEAAIPGAYEHQMDYAKRAVEKKTDEEIRVFLAAEKSDDDDKAAPQAITAVDIEKFRKDLPKRQEFIKGRPTKAEFEKKLRDSFNSAEVKALVLKESVSLWTLLWLFLGIGSAYKLGTGQEQE